MAGVYVRNMIMFLVAPVIALVHVVLLVLFFFGCACLLARE